MPLLKMRFSCRCTVKKLLNPWNTYNLFLANSAEQKITSNFVSKRLYSTYIWKKYFSPNLQWDWIYGKISTDTPLGVARTLFPQNKITVVLSVSEFSPVVKHLSETERYGLDIPNKLTFNLPFGACCEYTAMCSHSPTPITDRIPKVDTSRNI